MTQNYIERVCVQDNRVTDIYREECTRDEFINYRDSLENFEMGCYEVREINHNMFVASFLIMGECSMEICTLIHD